MPMKYPRLTTPLVRDGGELRPASWEEALDRADGRLQLLQGDQRAELRHAEVQPGRSRVEQRRQLQPNLTRAQRRRSGDGVRCGRRDELLRGDASRGPDRALGLERARGASDLLPPRAKGREPWRAADRRRSAAYALGA